jgi:hypothetical protein
MLELDHLEVAFKLSNLSAVSIHFVFDTIPLVVDLLDDDHESPYASSHLMPRDTAIQSSWIRAL